MPNLLTPVSDLVTLLSYFTYVSKGTATVVRADNRSEGRERHSPLTGSRVVPCLGCRPTVAAPPSFPLIAFMVRDELPLTAREQHTEQCASPQLLFTICKESPR